LLDNPFEKDSLRIYETVQINEETSLRRKTYPWNPKERTNAFASVRYMIDELNSVSFKYSQMDENVSNYGELRRPAFQPYSFDEFYLTNRTDYSLVYQGELKNLNLNATFAVNEFNRTLQQERFEFETDSFNEEFSNTDVSFFRALFGKTSVGYAINDNLSFLGGFQANQEFGTGDKIIDLSQPDSSKVKSLELAVFADARVKIKNSNASIGARVTNHSLYGTQFSPSIQLQHNLGPDWRLRAGYSRGFRSPGLKELYINFIDVNHYVIGNQELKPELANDFNLSLAYEPTKKTKLSYSGLIKLYKTNISNKIILSEFEQLRFQYQNLNNYSVQGVALDLSLGYKDISITNNFSLGYWYNRISEVSESPKDVPRYFIENDELQQTVTTGYEFIDLSFFTSLFDKKLNINFGIRNIMDVVYADINKLDPGANHALDTNINNQLVGRGRSYFVSLRYLLNVKSNN